MQPLTILGAHPYEEVRELCHAVKGCRHSNTPAIIRAAMLLVEAIDRPTVLVPVPSHTGFATDMFALAGAVCVEAAKRGVPCEVADVLACRPHPSLCDEKHKEGGGHPEDIRIVMYLMGGEKSMERLAGKYILLVDNVVDTGKTARAALSALPTANGILAIGDTGKHRE